MNSLPVHVAVGVIQDADGRILVSRRHVKQHQGGLWEFPGGKLEGNESVYEALRRELREELGIDVQRAVPFKLLDYQYEDKCVRLDVWRVLEFRGEPCGLESQPITWRALGELKEEDFPAANHAIIAALHLPPLLAITPPSLTTSTLSKQFEHYAQQGVELVQLRQPSLDEEDFVRLAKVAVCEAEKVGLRLVFNCGSQLFSTLNTEFDARRVGLHLNSSRLLTQLSRPVGSEVLLGASCHTLAELQHAEKIGVDYAMLSPVCELKHEDGTLLEWEGFAELARQVNLPIYALGGVTRDDLKLAKQSGAIGIAGIREFSVSC